MSALTDKVRERKGQYRIKGKARARWRKRCPQCLLPKHQDVCPYSPFRWTA